MTDSERQEYEQLQDEFLDAEGEIKNKRKIKRLNKLGKMSVEDRKTRNIDYWITDVA